VKVYLSILLFSLFIFGGCSSKEYFVPEVVQADWDKQAFLDERIIRTTADGAVLENGQILTKEGVQKYSLPVGYNYIGQSDGWIIASKVNGELLLQSIDDVTTEINLDLKKTIAGATVKGDQIAVLFATNEMALYTLTSKELIFKESGNVPVTVDTRIVNPFFLNELVLYLTLDGKIVIINSESKQVLRSMLVSSEDNFNNIIYFNVIDNVMVAATGYRLFSLSEKERREKYEMRDVIFSDEGIWITTKEGEVVALTPSLQLKAKRKYPFAHFLGMILTDDKLYLLEREGYIIELSKDLSESNVYELNIDDGYVYVGDKAFYINDVVYPIE
jgi:outer membrane protein assembly factor BamB